jgi:hypothetical protein
MSQKNVLGKSKYDFIFDGFTWSFSRLDTYETCPYAFFLEYVKCYDMDNGKLESSFGQFGKFCHTLLEKYFKGEIELFQLSTDYKNGFDENVTAYFPPIKGGASMRDSYFEKGLAYFQSFEGFTDFDVIGIENEYRFKVGDWDMVGFVDIEAKHKDTGELYIIDHKSKSAVDKKKITAKTKGRMVETIDGRYVPFHLLIQLYIYAIPFYEKYGKYPDKLAFNMFKIDDWYEVDFKIEDFEDAKTWVEEKLYAIYNDENYNKGADADGFWCDFVCGQRQNCEYSSRYFNINDFKG